MILANNLGFTYTLNVNEKATQDNLNKFITKTLGGKDGLKLPIQLDIKSSFNADQIKDIQTKINQTYKGKLNLDVKLKINTDSITTTALRQAQNKLNEKAEKLFMNVDLNIPDSTIAKFAKSSNIFKDLNGELEDVQDKLGSFNKSISLNFDNHGLKDSFAEIEGATARVNKQTQGTTEELEKQLLINKRKLESLQHSLGVKQKEIDLADKELEIILEAEKARAKSQQTIKETNAKIGALEKELKANKNIVDSYEQQQKALQAQAKTQQEVAESIEESQRKIAELQNKQTSVKESQNLAKEELQRHQNTISMTEAEIKALEDKMATLKAINNVAEGGASSTPMTQQSTSKKAEADTTIKNVERVAETAVKAGEEVSKELNSIVESEAKVAEQALEGEQQLVEAKNESIKAQKKANEANKKALDTTHEILAEIDLSNFRIVSSSAQAVAQENAITDALIKQRNVIRDIEDGKKDMLALSDEDIEDAKEYIGLLEKEYQLMLEAVGNNKKLNHNRSNMNRQLANLGITSDEDLENLDEKTRNRLYKTQQKSVVEGVSYKYTKALLDKITAMQGLYGDKIALSNELVDKHNKKLEAHQNRMEQISETRETNKVKDELLYPDAKTYVTERMYGFTPEELEDEIENWESKIRKKDSDHTYGTHEVDAMMAKIEEWKTKIKATDDKTIIDEYQEKIDKFTKRVNNLKGVLNTVAQLTALLDVKGGDSIYEPDFVGTEKEKKKNDATPKLQTMSQNAQALKRYCKEAESYIKAQDLMSKSSKELRLEWTHLLSQITKHESTVDGEVWETLSDRMKNLQNQLGFTEHDLEEFHKTRSAKTKQALQEEKAQQEQLSEEVKQLEGHAVVLKESVKGLDKQSDAYKVCQEAISKYHQAVKENKADLTTMLPLMERAIRLANSTNGTITPKNLHLNNGILPDDVFARLESQLGTYFNDLLNKKVPSYLNMPEELKKQSYNPDTGLTDYSYTLPQEYMKFHKDYSVLVSKMQELNELAESLKSPTSSRRFKELQDEVENLETKIFGDVDNLINTIKNDGDTFYDFEGTIGGLKKEFTTQVIAPLTEQDAQAINLANLKKGYEERLELIISQKKKEQDAIREANKQAKTQEERDKSFISNVESIWSDEFGFYQDITDESERQKAQLKDIVALMDSNKKSCEDVRAINEDIANLLEKQEKIKQAQVETPVEVVKPVKTKPTTHDLIEEMRVEDKSQGSNPYLNITKQAEVTAHNFIEISNRANEYLKSAQERLTKAKAYEDEAEEVYMNMMSARLNGTENTDPRNYQELNNAGLALQKEVNVEFREAWEELRSYMTKEQLEKYNPAKFEGAILTIAEQEVGKRLREDKRPISDKEFRDMVKNYNITNDAYRRLEMERKTLASDGKRKMEDGSRYSSTDEYKKLMSENKTKMDAELSKIYQTLENMEKQFVKVMSIAYDRQQGISEAKQTEEIEKQLAEKKKLLEESKKLLEVSKEKASVADEEIDKISSTVQEEQQRLALLEQSKQIEDSKGLRTEEEYNNAKEKVATLQKELIEHKKLMNQIKQRIDVEEGVTTSSDEQIAKVQALKDGYESIQKTIADTEQEVVELTAKIEAQNEALAQPVVKAKANTDSSKSVVDSTPASNVVMTDTEQNMLSTMKDMVKYSNTYTESLSKQSAMIVRMDSVYQDFMESLDKAKEPIPQLVYDTKNKESELELQKQADRLTLQENNKLAKRTEQLRKQYDLQLRTLESRADIQYIDEQLTKEQRQLIDSMTTTVTTSEQLEEISQQIAFNFKEMNANKTLNKTLASQSAEAVKLAEATEKQRKQLELQAEKEREVARAVQEKIKAVNEDLQQKYKQMSLTENINNLNDEQRQKWIALGQRLEVTGNTYKEVTANQQALIREMRSFNIEGLTNKLTKQDTMWGKLGATLKSIPAQYIGISEAIQLVERGLQGAFDRVMDLDSAYTNISMTMDVTKDKFATMQKTSIEAGKAQGILSSEVLDMMKIYASAGTTIEEINSQMAGTMAFKNVTGLDASTTTNSIQTILQQYKLLEDGAMSSADAIAYAGDVMTSVAYNLSKEESLAMQEVVSAVETAGNVIYQAGGSLEWYASITGTLTELMNASGSEIGNAMKMVSARVLQNKQVLEELGESTEDFELTTANAEKALNSIGVSIRGEGGDLRDLEDILGDVAGKWDTLSDSTKQYVSEMMAGNNRRSYLVGLLENYDRVIELQGIAENSEGAMFEASAKQAESLEGRLNSLNNTLSDLYDRFLNSDILDTGIGFLQGILEGTISVVDALDGKLVPALLAVGGAMTVIKWGSIVSGLDTVRMAIYVMTTDAWKAVTAMGALKLAMAGLGAGVAVGIGMTISKIQEQNKTLSTAKEKVEELKESLKTISTDTELITQWEELNQKLEEGKLTTDERAEVEAEILRLKNELISRSELYAGILEKETEQYEKQADALLGMTEYEKEKAIRAKLEETDISDGRKESMYSETYGMANGILNLEKKITDEKNKQAEIEAKLANDNLPDKERNKLAKDYEKSVKEANRLEEQRFKAKENFKSLMESGLAINEAIDLAEQEGIGTTEKRVAFSEEALAIYQEYYGSLEEAKETEEEITDAKLTQAELTERLSMSEEELAKKASETNAEYVSTLTAMRDARELLENINSDGLTLDNMSSMTSMFEDFTGNINDAGEVTAYLTDQIKAMEESALQSYQNMMNYDSEYWNSKVKNSQEWADYQATVYEQMEGLTAQLLNNELLMEAEKNNIKLELMEADLTNAKNVAEAQNITEGTLVNNVLGYWQQLFEGKSDGRNRDLDNLEEFLNAQGNAEITTIKQLVDAWNAYYTDKYNKISATIDNFAGDYGDLGNVSTEDMAQLNSLRKMARSFEGLMSTIDVSFDRVTANVDKAKVDIGSLTDPATKDSSSSKDTEKTVEDLEDLRDRYYEINNALKDVSNSLTLVETKMKKASGVEKLNLYKQEIALLQKQSQLLNEQKEQFEDRRWELHYQLQQAGFQFNGEDISNYQSKFEELRNWANSLAGDEKEEAKKRVQNLMEMVNEYTSLVKDEIPQVINEWEDMVNAIKEAEKEMAEAVTDSQKEVGEALEHYLTKRYDAIKAEIEKEKDLLNSQWEEEDYQDELAKEQRTLDEIQQQIDNLMRDTSEAGKLKLEQLKQQYLDQQEVINEMIKDHQREEANSRFDEEIEALDKELEELMSPENLVDMINQAITSGFVTIGEETVELNEIMNTWLNETGDGLYAIGDILRSELIDNLETAKALMADMGITGVGNTGTSKARTVDTYSGVEQVASSEAILRSSVNGGVLGGNTYSGGNMQVVFDVPLVNIEGNVTQDALVDLERMMKQQEERIIVKFAKMINKK